MNKVIFYLVSFAFSVACGCSFSERKNNDHLSWERKRIGNFFVMIPPYYSFDYTVDSVSGVIKNGELQIEVSTGFGSLSNKDDNTITQDTVATYIVRVSADTFEKNTLWLNWRDTSRTSTVLFPGQYEQLDMKAGGWNSSQRDTVLMIFNSVKPIKG